MRYQTTSDHTFVSGKRNGLSSAAAAGSVSEQHVVWWTPANFPAINGLSMTSGLGSVIGVFFGMYAQQGYHVEEIALLLTLPSLCIGLGTRKWKLLGQTRSLTVV